MTSILTNVAANTALMNLQNTVQNLQNVQNQISTGLRVNSAADNAAYFSIATVLRSDSAALSTVSDALNLGGSSLDVSSSALSKISTTLSDIKQQLLSATSPGVDRAKIQAAITQDQAQLKNIANSANFNGQNFLSVDSSATGYNATKEFISSFSRDAAGQISVGTIAINTANTALFDSGFAGGPAVAASEAATAAHPANVSGTVDTTLTSVSAAGALSITHYTPDAGVAANANTIADTVTVASGASAATKVTVEAVAGATALETGDTAGALSASSKYTSTKDGSSMTFYVAQSTDSTNAAKVQYYKYTVSGLTGVTGGILDTTDTTTVGKYTDAIGTVTSSSAGTGKSIYNLDIGSLNDSAANMAALNAFQKQVDAAISSVTASASALGTARARITSQSSFVSSLQTSINDGVGSLVDADLNVASTRLQALQVQQQLGVQSLSIANQSNQSILKLFQ
jgi:flagellin